MGLGSASDLAQIPEVTLPTTSLNIPTPVLPDIGGGGQGQGQGQTGAGATKNVGEVLGQLETEKRQKQKDAMLTIKTLREFVASQVHGLPDAEANEIIEPVQQSSVWQNALKIMDLSHAKFNFKNGKINNTMQLDPTASNFPKLVEIGASELVRNGHAKDQVDGKAQIKRRAEAGNIITISSQDGIQGELPDASSITETPAQKLARAKDLATFKQGFKETPEEKLEAAQGVQDIKSEANFNARLNKLRGAGPDGGAKDPEFFERQGQFVPELAVRTEVNPVTGQEHKLVRTAKPTSATRIKRAVLDNTVSLLEKELVRLKAGDTSRTSRVMSNITTLYDKLVPEFKFQKLGLDIFTEVVARGLTGAAMPEAEVERFKRIFNISAFDSAKEMAFKVEAGLILIKATGAEETFGVSLTPNDKKRISADMKRRTIDGLNKNFLNAVYTSPEEFAQDVQDGVITGENLPSLSIGKLNPRTLETARFGSKDPVPISANDAIRLFLKAKGVAPTPENVRHVKQTQQEFRLDFKGER